MQDLVIAVISIHSEEQVLDRSTFNHFPFEFTD